MRFITEFECDGTRFDANPSIIAGRKERGQCEIGRLLAESFGWEERGQTTLLKNDPVIHRFSLEIEAFPMDKWIEFKQRLVASLPDYDSGSRARIMNALHDLEQSTTTK